MMPPDVVGAIMPAIIFNSVDFPAPLGPMIANTSPASTSRSTPSTAGRPPKRLPTSRSSRIAIGRSRLRFVRFQRVRLEDDFGEPVRIRVDPLRGLLFTHRHQHRLRVGELAPF